MAIAESIVVSVPKKLDLSSALQFAREIHNLPEAHKYIFDFQEMGRIEPFAMLYLSTEIRRYRDHRSEARFQAINYEKHGYAGHMGFFRSFRLSFGNEPGEARGSARYFPITVSEVEQLKREAAESGMAVGDVIERHSQSLATILTQQDSLRGRLRGRCGFCGFSFNWGPHLMRTRSCDLIQPVPTFKEAKRA